MDRDTLFIIHTLKVDQKKHLHMKTDVPTKINLNRAMPPIALRAAGRPRFD
jgi:hypothetical protein